MKWWRLYTSKKLIQKCSCNDLFILGEYETNKLIPGFIYYKLQG